MTTNEIIIYDARPILLSPRSLLKAMALDVWSSRELAWRIFVRDFNAQYRQTLFGYIWAFLPPLLMTAVFVFLNSAGVTSKSNDNSILYTLSGMIYWQFFADCINNPLKTVEASKSLIAKLHFPREALLIASFLQTSISMLIRFVLLLAVCFFYKTQPSIYGIAQQFFGLISLFLFATCIGLFLLPIGLLFRDLPQAVSMCLTFLLFITPIGYKLAPDWQSTWYFKWNPLVYIISFLRDSFFSGSSPFIQPVTVVFLASLLLMFVGWIIYRISMPIIFEKLGA